MKYKEYLPKLGVLATPVTWDAFVLMIHHHIDSNRRKLEQSTDLPEIYRAQGAIMALTALTKLKDEINGLREKA
jgi:hypothetical protein